MQATLDRVLTLVPPRRPAPSFGTIVSRSPDRAERRALKEGRGVKFSLAGYAYHRAPCDQPTLSICALAFENYGNGFC